MVRHFSTSYTSQMSLQEMEFVTALLLDSLQSSPKMNGNSQYRVAATGWPWTHLRGKSPLEAIRNVMAEIERMDK